MKFLNISNRLRKIRKHRILRILFTGINCKEKLSFRNQHQKRVISLFCSQYASFEKFISNCVCEKLLNFRFCEFGLQHKLQDKIIFSQIKPKKGSIFFSFIRICQVWNLLNISNRLRKIAKFRISQILLVSINCKKI